MLSFQYVINIKIFVRLFLLHLVLKFCGYVRVIGDLNSDATLSSEILGLYLDFIKFIVEKVDLCNKVPNILKFSSN